MSIAVRAAVSVVVCSNHRLVRIGLRAILEREPAICVVAEAADWEELIHAVQRHQPHVVVLDESLSDQLSEQDPGGGPVANVVIVVENTNPDTLLALLRTDVRGVVHRDAPHDELVRAVRAVAAGGGFVSSELTGALIQVVRAVLPRPRRNLMRSDPLTYRESEVFDLVCQGMANREIATVLSVSEKTVKFHVSNLLAKANMRSRAQLIAFASAMPRDHRSNQRRPVTGPFTG